MREHVDKIKEFMGRHPGVGYASIGRQLGEQLGVKLSEAQMSVIRRIMQSIRSQEELHEMREHVDPAFLPVVQLLRDPHAYSYS